MPELLLICDCGAITVITPGNIIRCNKCGNKPKIEWDGREGKMYHLLGQVKGPPGRRGPPR